MTVKRLRDRSIVGVGLGYVTLGQELGTLFGGERQRLKVAIEMSGATEACVLDEPTTALHMQAVDNVVGLLDRVVESGRTVIVIAHNLGVVPRADWVIDLRAGGGHDGGRVIFEGPPDELVWAGVTDAAVSPVAGRRWRRGSDPRVRSGSAIGSRRRAQRLRAAGRSLRSRPGSASGRARHDEDRSEQHEQQQDRRMPSSSPAHCR